MGVWGNREVVNDHTPAHVLRAAESQSHGPGLNQTAGFGVTFTDTDRVKKKKKMKTKLQTAPESNVYVQMFVKKTQFLKI